MLNLTAKTAGFNKLWLVFSGWFFYNALYLGLINTDLKTLAGYFPLFAQVGLDIVVTVSVLYLYKTVPEK